MLILIIVTGGLIATFFTVFFWKRCRLVILFWIIPSLAVFWILQNFSVSVPNSSIQNFKGQGKGKGKGNDDKGKGHGKGTSVAQGKDVVPRFLNEIVGIGPYQKPSNVDSETRIDFKVKIEGKEEDMEDAGEDKEESRNKECVFMTFLGTNDYLRGVLALYASLKHVKTKHSFVAMISNKISDEVQQNLVQNGIDFFSVIQDSEVELHHHLEESKKHNHQQWKTNWQNSFGKLHMFRATQYAKIVFFGFRYDRSGQPGSFMP